jgi:predicted acyl esterase
MMTARLPRRDFLGLTASAAAMLALPGCGPLRREDRLSTRSALLSDIMVPMRDGVHLCTDVYLPARNGVAVNDRFPVILERTPYNKTAPSRSERTPGQPRPARPRRGRRLLREGTGTPWSTRTTVAATSPKASS